MLKNNFLPYLVIGNETEGNFLLRKKQYEKSENEMFDIAKEIVIQKTKNQLNLLKSQREKSEKEKKEIKKLEEIITKIPDSE